MKSQPWRLMQQYFEWGRVSVRTEPHDPLVGVRFVPMAQPADLQWVEHRPIDCSAITRPNTAVGVDAAVLPGLDEGDEVAMQAEVNAGVDG